MPTVSFARLMEDAERRGYAVGYFESWNMESLLAVADAAEAARSPVILGFSGIALPRTDRVRPEHLADYAELGVTVCNRLSVPACLLFNESPSFDWVVDAIYQGFGMVMFADEGMDYETMVEKIRKICRIAHLASVAVEGEPHSLPGVAGDLLAAPGERHMTDPARAREFAEATRVDSIAVNVGQAHLHGRGEVRLDLDRVSALKRAVNVPLALHGATSVSRSSCFCTLPMPFRGISPMNRTDFGTLKRASPLAQNCLIAASSTVTPWTSVTKATAAGPPWPTAPTTWQAAIPG